MACGVRFAAYCVKRKAAFISFIPVLFYFHVITHPLTEKSAASLPLEAKQSNLQYCALERGLSGCELGET